jgi:hypothetical protein
MIFQNEDVAIFRKLAARRGHWHMATVLRLIGVPFEDVYVILFGKEPRGSLWEGMVQLKHLTKRAFSV